MKRKDWLLIALVPLALLLIPLTGQLTVEGWHWKWNDFVMAWAVFTFATWFLRFLVTRPPANFPHKIGAGLAFVTGFLVTWVTLAVQIIGEDNPGNAFYLLTIVGGLIGVAISRLRPVGLSVVAFAMAASFLLIPAVAVGLWPADFDPGYPKIQAMSAVLAALFSTSGFLFRQAAANRARATSTKPLLHAQRQTRGRKPLTGAAEGQFPGYRTIESGDFEEERRLFYVAVTRAKNELYITYPRVASRPGPGGMMLQPTRFLRELPSDLYDELRSKRSWGR
jgi:hypothetical protein